jgi:hypothetical protein
LSIFDSFKEKVIGVRKAVEEFKDNHKMASEAISLVINSMPEPFNKFSSVIWNGLEKQGGADSSAKLLEILEKIENNTEQSFSEIKTNISELIQFGAKTEDIQNLGEQIRISNESVVQNLKEAFNEELKKAAQRLEESFKKDQTELHLLESNLQDSSSGLKQALFVTSTDQAQPSEEGIKKAAEELYNSSKKDPFFFVAAIKYSLQGKSETFDFIKTDIMKKIESLGNEEELWNAALLCSFMGMFGIMPIQVDKPTLPANKILECGCGSIYQDYLEYLSSNDEAFLFKEEKGVYNIRHELWALEFLIYIYCKEFSNYISGLSKKQGYGIWQLSKIKELIGDRVKQLIACILGNIEINDHLSILNRCSSLYNDYDRSKPICKLVVDNYVVPDKMNDSEKAKVYCYGLGNFYNSIKDYPRSLQFYDKAIASASARYAIPCSFPSSQDC